MTKNLQALRFFPIDRITVHLGLFKRVFGDTIIVSGNKVQCVFVKPFRLSTQKMGALIPLSRALHRSLSPLIST